MPKATSSKIAKYATIVTIGYTISRILGYLREFGLAYIFGSNYKTDAYIMAFSVPDLLYYLLAGGALSAAFIPVFTDYLTQKKEEEAWKIASSLANLLIILTSLGIVLGIIFAHRLYLLLAPGFDAKTMSLCVLCGRIMFSMVLFFILSALCSGILNSLQHFTTPAAAFIVYNIPIILACFILGPKIDIIAMPLGVLTGAIAMVAIQLPVIMKKGMHYCFILNLSHPGVKRVIQLFIPAMIGLSISQLNLFNIPYYFGSGVGEGAVTYLRFANRLIFLPLGVFASAIAISVFPTLSIQVSEGAMKSFKRTLAKGIRATFLFSLPSTVGLIILREPIVRLLFQHGKFTSADTEATAYALLFFSLGIFAHSALQVITRGFYSFQDAITPVKVGLATVGLNILFCLLFQRGLQIGNCLIKGVGGIALAPSLTATINLLILFSLLRKKVGGIDTKGISICFIKYLFASIIMGIVCLLISQGVEEFIGVSHLLGVATQVGLAMVGGVIVYTLLIFLLKMEDAYMFWGMVKERLHQ